MTEPYYQRDGITIYHGDCREILPTLEPVDVVVTSPPYNTLPVANKPSGLHGPKGGRGKWVKKASEGYADQMPENTYQQWLVEILSLALSKCRGLMWVNHKVRYRNGHAVHPVRFFPWPIYSEIIWDRRGSMALNCRRFAPSHECILGFGTPSYWDDGNNIRLSVWQLAPERSERHPCPFPIKLVEPLIVSSCPAGGFILDPFAGIGSTMIAAKRAGRQAIGIEIEERYCEIAAKRLAQGVLPLAD